MVSSGHYIHPTHVQLVIRHSSVEPAGVICGEQLCSGAVEQHLP